MTPPSSCLRRVYLDHAATTSVREEVRDAMMPFFSERFGNPSSLHAEGREAREALEEARETIRSACGAKEHELLFCSGGTEGNNAALMGLLLGTIERGEEALPGHRRVVVTSEVEHPSVLASRGCVEALGGAWRVVAPTRSGRVELGTLGDSIRDDTLLVSLQWANNEVGVLQPVEEAAALARSRGAYFHSDAVQVLGKLPLDLGASSLDLVTVSAHKIEGPKGIGGLFLRRGIPFGALLRGGAQESGLRAGTENVALAVGFARAVELAEGGRETSMKRLGFLREELRFHIERRWPAAIVNGLEVESLPTILNVSFPWVEGESLLKLLDWHGVAASTGSACNTRAQKPSHVLRSMGRSDREIRGSLRLSLGPSTSREDVFFTLDALTSALRQLGGLAPE